MVMARNSLHVEDVTPVRLFSVEVWNANTGKLVGGELGYSVGAIYSSLTGFSDEDAAGSVQLGESDILPAKTSWFCAHECLTLAFFLVWDRLVALGKLLTKCGFEYWDLGMEMEYKRKIGAELMGRSDFLTEVKRLRIENKDVVLYCEGKRANAKVLIDWEPLQSVSCDMNLQTGTNILRTVSSDEE